jgi:2-succinyl-5-enolpyruvyl-6-hydroxy-3-cyclohexene-1-carboxylate synthase
LKNTDKIQLIAFVDLCAAYGMRKVVISPGSRNAPIILAFHNHPEIDCYVIPDERSASYFALGIAQYTQQPVGMLCTSGTAALNYTAAMAEAYYQKLPLVAITADRPAEWVDQADGQTINQQGIYANFSVYQSNLPVEIQSEHDSWYLNRMVRDGFTLLLKKNQPIHFNIPLREPLYNMAENLSLPVSFTQIEFKQNDYKIPENIALEYSNYTRILVIIGMHHPDSEYSKQLSLLSKHKNIAILTETLSNIESEEVFQISDGLISAISSKKTTSFEPELIISFGCMLLSKQVKEWLRSVKSAKHWVINESETVPDVFKKIDRHISANPTEFIKQLVNLINNNGSDFYNVWRNSYFTLNKLQNEYINNSEWSDITVFYALSRHVPSQSIVQLGNSSVVRYAQFFKWNHGISFYSNRGTSGIDGSSSTAVGMASQTDKILTLISGDISFLYDSNALWNSYKGKNLRIIVINNKGGSIFSLIPGPDNTGLLNEYFTTHIPVSIEHICKAYQINYFHAKNEAELNDSIDRFYNADSCSLLEIETDSGTNTQHWKNYFNTIKTNFAL